MLHKIRWTPQKIEQRLKLIEPMAYRRRSPILAFRYKTLPDPLETPPVGSDVDDSTWDEIRAKTYWGTWKTDFIMRTLFQVPPEMADAAQVVLFLPLGEAGDFSHPEALAYNVRYTT